MDGALKPYRHFRKYTEEEIKSEFGEYFDNQKARKTLPKLFGDKEDMEYHIKDSRLELLDMEELRSLKNSDTKEILSEPTQKARMLRTLRLMKSYDKNYKRLFYGFSKLEKLPPPLVVRDKNNDLYLLAGNSRLIMGISLGYNVPVKIIPYSKEMVKESVNEKVNHDIKQIYKLLIKYGQSAKDAAQMMKKHWKYVSKKYGNSGPRGMATALIGLHALGERIVKEEKLNKDVLIDIASKIIKLHNLKSKIKFSKSSGNKADYDWVDDVITLMPNPKNTLDFIESVLHEVDHAVMRKKYGAAKYEQLYTKAGELMIQKGKDFYWDNPFEVQARKYEKNAKKYIKKLNLKK